MESKLIPQVISREILESCQEPCFTVNESLAITYCNKAWDQFALLNQGSPKALRAHVISRSLLDFVPDDIKTYHAGLFQTARALGKVVSHDYECSSATLFRLYRMQIYPLEEGFVVINSLRVEHPHDRTPAEPNEALYRPPAGMIRMCANCGRTNRADDPAVWDWVPDYVEHMREQTTHGVCPLCLEYYYRPYMGPRP